MTKARLIERAGLDRKQRNMCADANELIVSQGAKTGDWVAGGNSDPTIGYVYHQLDTARAIMSRMMLGMKAWAADEDGIHDEAIDSFWEGARFLGVDFELKVNREELQGLSSRVPSVGGQEGGTK